MNFADNSSNRRVIKVYDSGRHLAFSVIVFLNEENIFSINRQLYLAELTRTLGTTTI